MTEQRRCVRPGCGHFLPKKAPARQRLCTGCRKKRYSPDALDHRAAGSFEMGKRR